MRVLVVEDELRMASLIRRGLAAEGLAADLATKGEDALWMAEARDYDAIVLDVMLPGLNGLETCRQLRTNGVWAPVLMLTARDAVEDRVAGLDNGADDYLVKPFALEELLARVRAQLRRRSISHASARSGVVSYKDVRVNQDTRHAFRGDRSLRLRPTTFELLAYFVRHPERVLSRQELLTNVWGYEHMGSSNLVDVTVLDLRRHLEQGGAARLIHTVRRAGYMLATNGNGRV